MADDTTQGAAQNTGAATGGQQPGSTTMTGGTADPNATAGSGAGTQTGTQGQGDAQGAAKAADGAGKETGQAGAEPPKAYEAFTVPEGMVVDEKLLGAVSPVLQELKVDQAGAQKLVDAYAKLKAEEFKAEGEAFTRQVEDWGKQTREDKELGGNAFDTNVKAAQRALAAFGTPELKTLLDETGLGNHPEVIRAFKRIGEKLTEDSMVHPGGAGAGQRSIEERLYGTKAS